MWNQLRFDAYGCNLPMEPQQVIGHIVSKREELGIVAQADSPGRYSYLHRRDFIFADGMKHLTVQYGGRNIGTHVSATGGISPRVAGIVRDLSPAHKVSRVDVCLDASRPGLWEEIKARGLFHARQHDLKPKHIWDPNKPEEGETLYIGSRKSPACLRLYQKGWQQAQMKGDEIGEEDPHWVRIEPEFKPRTQDKAKLCALSPQEVLGYSRWVRLFFEQLLSLNIEPIARAERAHKTFLQSAEYALQTYDRSFMTCGAFLLAVEHGLMNPTNEEMIEAFLEHARRVMTARHPANGFTFQPAFEDLTLIARAVSVPDEEEE